MCLGSACLPGLPDPRILSRSCLLTKLALRGLSVGFALHSRWLWRCIMLALGRQLFFPRVPSALAPVHLSHCKQGVFSELRPLGVILLLQDATQLPVGDRLGRRIIRRLLPPFSGGASTRDRRHHCVTLDTIFAGRGLPSTRQSVAVAIIPFSGMFAISSRGESLCPPANSKLSPWPELPRRPSCRA